MPQPSGAPSPRATAYGTVLLPQVTTLQPDCELPKVRAGCPPHWTPPRRACPDSQGACQRKRPREDGWTGRWGKEEARALNCGRFSSELSASQNSFSLVSCPEAMPGPSRLDSNGQAWASPTKPVGSPKVREALPLTWLQSGH